MYIYMCSWESVRQCWIAANALEKGVRIVSTGLYVCRRKRDTTVSKKEGYVCVGESEEVLQMLCVCTCVGERAIRLWERVIMCSECFVSVRVCRRNRDMCLWLCGREWRGAPSALCLSCVSNKRDVCVTVWERVMRCSKFSFIYTCVSKKAGYVGVGESDEVLQMLCVCMCVSKKEGYMCVGESDDVLQMPREINVNVVYTIVCGGMYIYYVGECTYIHLCEWERQRKGGEVFQISVRTSQHRLYRCMWDVYI